MNELEKIKKLSELKTGSKEYCELINDLILNDPNYSQSSKDEFLKNMKEIQDEKLSQDKFIRENKHREILIYDVETFMPIYKGIKKWDKYYNK